MEHSNSALSDALRPIPKFAVGGWVWVYSKAATIRRGTKMDTDAKVLKSKLSINWTSPYKSSQLAPVTRITPRTVPLLPLSSFMDLPSKMPGSDARRGVSVQHCKPCTKPQPCTNPHDHGEMRKYWPAGLTQYVLNNFFKKAPPCHVSQDDVSTPLQRLEAEVTGHQAVRGRGRVIAVMYETHRTGLSRPSW